MKELVLVMLFQPFNINAQAFQGNLVEVIPQYDFNYCQTRNKADRDQFLNQSYAINEAPKKAGWGFKVVEIKCVPKSKLKKGIQDNRTASQK